MGIGLHRTLRKEEPLLPRAVPNPSYLHLHLHLRGGCGMWVLRFTAYFCGIIYLTTVMLLDPKNVVLRLSTDCIWLSYSKARPVVCAMTRPPLLRNASREQIKLHRNLSAKDHVQLETPFLLHSSPRTSPHNIGK